MNKTNQPLAGVRILDLTQLYPGPLATMMLGDMGAEVIKIENPIGGDKLRVLANISQGMSDPYLLVNRSKQSLALNLKHPKAKEVFMKLVATADVIVEGFKPGTLERLGFGYDTLKQYRRNIILCSISGYGQTGPDAMRAGHDINYCAKAGILALSGTRQGPPALSGVQIADVTGGSWQAIAGIFGALYQREKTGQGQWLDISMADGVLTTATLALSNILAGQKLSPRGQAPLSGGLPEYGIYKTKDDRYLAVGALEPVFFARLCQALDCPHLENKQLVSEQEKQEIAAQFSKKFMQKTQAEWIEVFSKIDACVEPIFEDQEILADAQYNHRRMFFKMDDPKVAAITQIATPLKFANQKEPDLAPPSLGEHTAQILSQLGLSAEEIKTLEEDGVIGIHKATH
jgi:crotonobetainyl-CoA:carnitine CoA-transferase CaiB-like acyl-CoA transferase